VAALVIAFDGYRAYFRYRRAPIGEAPAPRPVVTGGGE
jgi:hypothetical protein